jgi:peptidoglycan/LPS O-acetylase OafA/YrhL
MFFYLLFPVLIDNWTRSWWWKWLLSALIAGGMYALSIQLQLPDQSSMDEVTLHGMAHINPLARLFEFVTGMVTCQAFCALEPAAKRLSGVVFTALEIGAIAAAGYVVTNNADFMGFLAEPLGGAWIAWETHSGGVIIFPVVIVVFAFGRGLLSQALGSRLMVTLGEMSYAIYLVHMTVFTAWRLYVMQDTSADYAGLAICLALTLLLSAALWQLIERPARFAIRRWLAPQPVMPVGDDGYGRLPGFAGASGPESFDDRDAWRGRRRRGDPVYGQSDLR